MTTNEAYEQVYSEQPPLLYLSGKTCTGKTTFSDRLRASCGYEVVELDEVVVDAIVKPFGLQSSQGDVFVSVYKAADNAEWIDIFATEAQKRIKSVLAQNKKVIVDGAIANPKVIQRIFDGLPNTIFIYFHPLGSSADYRHNLTKRFNSTTARDHNGLPKAFWKCIDQGSFARFCKDKIITPQLEENIANYARLSSQESIKRLEALHRSFSHIIVVDV